MAEKKSAGIETGSATGGDSGTKRTTRRRRSGGGRGVRTTRNAGSAATSNVRGYGQFVRLTHGSGQNATMLEIPIAGLFL